MSLIDTGKSAYSQIVDRLYPVRVVFHHVPKCGGTSLGRALRSSYLLSQTTIDPEATFAVERLWRPSGSQNEHLAAVSAFRERLLAYYMFKDIRCIAAHVPYSSAVGSAFGDRYKFVTILREPLERFVSHYYWSHGRPTAHGFIPEDFEEFLSTERARRLGASYVEYFSGLGGDASTSDGVAGAVATLRKFDLVGFVDNTPAFAHELSKLLNRKLKIGHENKGRNSQNYKSILNGPFREKLVELCGPDLEVWKSVKG